MEVVWSENELDFFLFLFFFLFDFMLVTGEKNVCISMVLEIVLNCLFYLPQIVRMIEFLYIVVFVNTAFLLITSSTYFRCIT